MNKRQSRFVEEYLKDLNATEAAIRAGYSSKTARAIGSENLTKPDIKQAVDAAMAERSKRTLITADKVLERLEEITDRCMQKEMVMEMIDGELVPSGEWKFNAAGANKSLELIGKHLGMFKERVEHSGPDGSPIELANKTELSDAELQTRIDEKLKALGKKSG